MSTKTSTNKNDFSPSARANKTELTGKHNKGKGRIPLHQGSVRFAVSLINFVLVPENIIAAKQLPALI